MLRLTLPSTKLFCCQEIAFSIKLKSVLHGCHIVLAERKWNKCPWNMKHVLNAKYVHWFIGFVYMLWFVIMASCRHYHQTWKVKTESGELRVTSDNTTHAAVDKKKEKNAKNAQHCDERISINAHIQHYAVAPSYPYNNKLTTSITLSWRSWNRFVWYRLRRQDEH